MTGTISSSGIMEMNELLTENLAVRHFRSCVVNIFKLNWVAHIFVPCCLILIQNIANAKMSINRERKQVCTLKNV